MSSGGRKAQYWILKEKDCLEEIVPLLGQVFSESIEESDIRLNFMWTSSGSIKENSKYAMNSVELNGNVIKYLPAYAAIESLKVKKDDVPRTPRDVAVGLHYAYVMFVEDGGSVKVIVSSSASYISKVRTKLFNKDKQWGELSYKDINLVPEFFYWLMSKKGEEIELGHEKFNLYDLDAFNCSTDRKKHQYNGKGSGIDDETPVGTMVSLNNFFTGLGLKLGSKDHVLKFTLSKDLETEIKYTDCHIINDKGFDFFDQNKLILKIYFQVIPGLVKAFNNQRATWPRDEIEFKKHVAVRAIAELMAETGLSINDINTYIKNQ